MHIGSLIKYHRTKRGITQKELASGICSIPHLSKIENNSKDANKETLRLLLEKLSINLQDVEKSEQNIRLLLKDFLEHIQYYSEDKVTEAFIQLQNYEDFIVFTDYIFLYELYKLRYYLFLSDKIKAEEQLNWLQTQKQNISQHEQYLLSYFSALLLMLKGRYEESEEQLTQTLEGTAELGIFEGEIYYHLAIVKGYLDQSSQAVNYGKKALEFYKNQYNFKRILHVQMALAISYSRAKVYDESLEIYSHLLRNAEIMQDKKLLPQIYHNIGDLHHKMENYSISLMYFKKSISIIPKDTENYLRGLYNLAVTEYDLERFEDSRDSFELLKEEATIMRAILYRYLAIYYLLMVDDNQKDAMKFLEEKLIPHTAKLEYREPYKVFSNILANYYKQEGKFDKAVEYLV